MTRWSGLDGRFSACPRPDAHVTTAAVHGVRARRSRHGVSVESWHGPAASLSPNPPTRKRRAAGDFPGGRTPRAERGAPLRPLEPRASEPGGAAVRCGGRAVWQARCGRARRSAVWQARCGSARCGRARRSAVWGARGVAGAVRQGAAQMSKTVGAEWRASLRRAGRNVFTRASGAEPRGTDGAHPSHTVPSNAGGS